MSLEYKPITKLVEDNKNNIEIQCIGMGTEQCVIHKGHPDCTNCPIYKAMMLRLYSLENFYMSVEETLKEE